MKLEKNKKSQLLLLIIYTIIFIFFILILISTEDKSSLKKSFCKGTLVNGWGIVDYCDGNPFVCNNKNCNYVDIYEDCHSEAGIYTSCEQIKIKK